jgi:hypothetical protein
MGWLRSQPQRPQRNANPGRTPVSLVKIVANRSKTTSALASGVRSHPPQPQNFTLEPKRALLHNQVAESDLLRN